MTPLTGPRRRDRWRARWKILRRDWPFFAVVVELVIASVLSGWLLAGVLP